MNRSRQASRGLVTAALIAALYAATTLLLWQFSSFAVQVRVSEALCVLPMFTDAAVPGLFLGCFLANLLSGNVIDAVFGSLTTLAAAFLTALLRRYMRKHRGKGAFWLAPLPSVLLNTLTVPLILFFGYGITSFGGQDSTAAVLALEALSVFAGQTVSCYGLGLPLFKLLQKLDRNYHLFDTEESQ